MQRILILEDEIEAVEILADLLKECGYEIDYALQPKDVMPKLHLFKPDLVTLDLKFGEGGERVGLEILEEIRTEYSVDELPVIAVSATMNAIKLTELHKIGLNDRVDKPITNNDDFIKKIKHCLLLNAAKQQENDLVKVSAVVGQARVILDLIDQLSHLAAKDLPVLFEGETGTGKTHFAELYHQFSPRRKQKLFAVEPANLPGTLFESEIYGYEKGAFNGALTTKKGKAEEAEGGILFLDEIGDLNFEQQVKLLNLIRNKTIIRLGSNRPIPLNITIITATWHDLPAMVKKGTFREDLYHSFGVRVHMPALREHPEDIPELAKHMLLKYREINPATQGIEEDAIRQLMTKPWEANIRQLGNCICYGMTHCRSEKLSWKDLEGFFKTPSGQPAAEENIYDKNYTSLKEHIKKIGNDIETRYLVHHLEKHYQNIPKTAETIGVARQQLNQILRRLKIGSYNSEGGAEEDSKWSADPAGDGK